MSKQTLAKSKKSAAIMAVVYHVALFATIVLYNLATGSSDESASSSGPDITIVSVFAILVVLLLLIALGTAMVSGFIHRLDDSHFGVRGAIGWAVVGILDALLWKTIRLDTHFSKPVRDILRLAVIGVSYGLVFKLVPFARKTIHHLAIQKNSSHKDDTMEATQ